MGARAPDVYLLNELLADLAGGHNIVSTVAIECGYGYRHDGSAEMNPVGESEFLENVAAQAAGNLRSKPRIAAAIVAFADLALGRCRGAGARSPSSGEPKAVSAVFVIRRPGTRANALRREAPPGNAR